MEIALLAIHKNSCADALNKGPPADTEAVVVESVRPLREPMALSSYAVGAAEEGQVVSSCGPHGQCIRARVLFSTPLLSLGLAPGLCPIEAYGASVPFRTVGSNVSVNYGCLHVDRSLLLGTHRLHVRS